MTFQQRLSAARTEAKLSQSQLAEKAHAGQSTIAAWESGKNEPNLSTILKLAVILNKQPEWLAFGVDGAVSSDMFYLPEYDVRALSGAGGLQDVAENNKIETILHRYAFPKAEFRATFGVGPESVVVFEVVGDSMQSTLNPGEKVFVNLNDKVPSPPGIFVVWDGLGLVLKRIEYVAHSNPSKIRIISDNKAYDTYERLLDEAYIQGRVIGSWQRR